MTAPRSIPRPRAGAGRRGGWYWRTVLASWELSVTEHEVCTPPVERSVRWPRSVSSKLAFWLRSASWKLASLVRRVSAVNRWVRR
jgi:hypothetical protein